MLDNNSIETLRSAKWGWACRSLDATQERFYIHPSLGQRVGDVVVARVEEVRNHTRIVDRSGSRTRIYAGDLIVGVLGNRYATDAFHGLSGIDEDGYVDMLTNAGMLGQVQAQSGAVSRPTRAKVLGFLYGESGRVVNLVERNYRPRSIALDRRDVVFMLGTGMNAGKTTSATKLVRGLMKAGLRVAAIKITGSVSPGDRSELAATGALYTADFSDLGFPSTYLLDLEELQIVAETMIEDARQSQPDIIVVELADGVLQRETAALISSSKIREQALGAVLAAPCALSALMGVATIQSTGLPVIGVTGIITNAPLFQHEFEARSAVPVLSSLDDGSRLGGAVRAALIDELDEVA